MTDTILLSLAEGKINFADVLAFIDEHYHHSPTAFKNGGQLNAASENQGSARVLYFAQEQNLSKEDTLRLFAEHYQNVLETPDATNHQNIRQFMQQGWEGVLFEGAVLSPK